LNPQREEAGQLLTAGRRDRTAFRILLRDAESPAEIMLFHAQQAAEKFIKAVLALRGVTYRRTHDLVELNELATQNGIAIPVARELLVRLGPYAVEFRYLGAKAPEVSLEEAEAAIDALLAWAGKLTEATPR
jgi:HEPN domain-containing protein